ncbi:MAG: cytochrome c-type biogenesis protein CcmH [Pseudomonadota bacterium]|nr:cytochrome c-type biogenesis protein CcmH [Pseudomonadota bacterium]
MRLTCVLALATLTALSPMRVAVAAQALPTVQDPVAASRAVRLSEQLRCLVCQNQTIAESNADLALDLRQQIREQIAAGKADGEILQYMVSRYGDFVLYRPPFKATTALLWVGPALLLMLGLAALRSMLRRGRAEPRPPLAAADREKASRLLAGDGPEEIA